MWEEYNVVDDVETIVQKKMVTRNQNRIAEILLLLKEIPKLNNKKTDKKPGEETDEQPDTTDMPALESEESVARQRNQLGKSNKSTAQEKRSAKRIKNAYTKSNA